MAVYLAVPFLLAVLASPALRAWLRGTGSIRQTLSNAGVGLLFLGSQGVVRGASLAAYAAVAHAIPWKLPDGAPWAWALGFVCIDLVYYLQHRLEHAVPLLWAIHAVHHQSRDYNLSVSFRVGVFASFSTLLFHLLLAVAGVSARAYAVLATVHGALLFTLHARTRFTFGPGRVFNAPVFHRVHHGTDPMYIDRNFGGVFLVWDRVFGTFVPYTTEPRFGVLDEPSPALPIAANTAPFAALFRRVAHEPTLRRKLRALFVR